jgi:hypothetical protein
MVRVVGELYAATLAATDRTVENFEPILDVTFVSMNQPEAQDTREDQKDRYDVIEQLRHDQDQDTGEQRNDRLKVCDAYSHSFIPCFVRFTSRRAARWSRAITVPPNSSTGFPR